MKILITGASGFIGSFIVEEAINRGFDTWAAVRKSSSKAYLQDERIKFIELNLSSKSQLVEQLRGHDFDYVVHAAGVTKCINKQDFARINTEGTKNLVDALLEVGMPLKRFVFISSLSIFGAIREKPVRKPSEDNPWIYSPILLTDTPKPNTAYGKSKLKAEEYLLQQKDFPFTILRPTGVYGPREKDYFMMAKSIRQHIDFAVGYQPQEITFVFMMDVVQAIYKCIESVAAEGKAYFLSDGEVYNSRRFSDLLQQHLGNPWVLHIKAPLWLLRIICWISTRVSHLTGKMNALNDDKFHILSQRNWQCDIEPAIKDFGYQPQWKLEQGVERTIKWYKKNGWI